MKNNHREHQSKNSAQKEGAKAVHLSNGMNITPLQKIKKDPAYSLSESERSDMRMKLEAHMRMPRQAVERHVSFVVYLMRPMPLTALALIIAISSSSVSFAAYGALPGEILYPVKVGVNERVELALASSEEAKAHVRIRHVEERLRETEVIAVRGTFDERASEEVAGVVAENIEAVTEAVEELEARGEAIAASALEERVATALLAHAEILDAHADNFTEEPKEALESLAVSVRETMEDVEVSSEDVRTEDAAYALQYAQELAYENLRKFNELIEDGGVSQETLGTLSEEYAKINETFVSITEGGVDDEIARIAYEEISRDAYRAATLLRAAKRIAEETDQEVIVVLAEDTPAAASMARAKGSEADTATAMLMTISAPEEMQEEPVFELQFRLQKED